MTVLVSNGYSWEFGTSRSMVEEYGVLFSQSLTQSDVLLGRGKRSHNWQGNVWFRQLVAERSTKYRDCDNPVIRDEIAKEIIQIVNREGGRFLREKTNLDNRKVGLPVVCWNVASPGSVRTKVKQALRDYGCRNGSSEKSDRRKAPPPVPPPVVPPQRDSLSLEPIPIAELGRASLLTQKETVDQLQQNDALVQHQPLFASQRQAGVPQQPYSNFPRPHANATLPRFQPYRSDIESMRNFVAANAHLSGLLPTEMEPTIGRSPLWSASILNTSPLQDMRFTPLQGVYNSYPSVAIHNQDAIGQRQILDELALSLQQQSSAIAPVFGNSSLLASTVDSSYPLQGISLGDNRMLSSYRHRIDTVVESAGISTPATNLHVDATLGEGMELIQAPNDYTGTSDAAPNLKTNPGRDSRELE